MYDDDYDSYYAAESLWYLFYFFIIITPVIPAGDMGVYFINEITEGKPMIWMLIASWLLSVVVYGYILIWIWTILSDYMHSFFIVILGYAQGVALAFVVENLGYSTFSSLVTGFTEKVFTFLTSTV
jgi:hypothetical protein